MEEKIGAAPADASALPVSYLVRAKLPAMGLRSEVLLLAALLVLSLAMAHGMEGFTLTSLLP